MNMIGHVIPLIDQILILLKYILLKNPKQTAEIPLAFRKLIKQTRDL